MKFLIKNNKQKTCGARNSGYTLLFAVLVSSVVLAIGVTILTVSKKEFLLSSSARDSSAALYAADSGIECGAYADAIHADGTGNSFATDTPRTGYMNCGDLHSSVSVQSPSGTYGPYIFTFSVKFGNSSDACATINVTKQFQNGATSTNIVSRGYNVGWDSNGSGGLAESCDIPSSKKVERAFQLSY